MLGQGLLCVVHCSFGHWIKTVVRNVVGAVVRIVGITVDVAVVFIIILRSFSTSNYSLVQA